MGKFNFKRESVVENCKGCDKIIPIDGEAKCIMYEKTACQWTRVGGCAGRTHNLATKVEQKFSTDSIKVSKRKMGKKA